MRFVGALRRAALAAGALLATAGAAATWTACADSDALPSGEGWNRSSDSEAGGAAEPDASTSGPTVDTDSGVGPGPQQDGAIILDVDAAKRDGSGSGDAGLDLDTGSPLTTFTLLDTNVNTIVDGEPVSGWDPIPEGSTMDLAKVGTALSIRANTTPPVVGHVVFVLDGTYTHTESAAPYTLCSDNGLGTINPCPFTLGAHVLVATPYSADAGADLDAGAMPSTTLYFTIVDTADGGYDAGAAD
jgi:hypothetical protein